MGKLIVLEGIDGSGKTTQYNMLCDALRSKDREFVSLEFPQYGEPSSALIKMYLKGEFGTAPGDVNPYAASSFYAVDRYASYKKVWGDYYSSGGLVVAARYTTSNAIHQASKLEPGKRESFFKWLYEYEFNLMGLPRPDLVIYFSVPVEKAAEYIEKRRLETGQDTDIHEKNLSYLRSCQESAEMAADFYGWIKIDAVRNGEFRNPGDIHRNVINLVEKFL
ncbi:MAG: thymidylate kinase [Clostridiales bacterium]|jgi:dTMP kinase|nr:thymidylate kinase [Clostridiales bacterium]